MDHQGGSVYEPMPEGLRGKGRSEMRAGEIKDTHASQVGPSEEWDSQSTSSGLGE